MKIVEIEIDEHGNIKIFAEGQYGVGTAGFTELVATTLGKIEERHVGKHKHDHGVSHTSRRRLTT